MLKPGGCDLFPSSAVCGDRRREFVILGRRREVSDRGQ